MGGDGVPGGEGGCSSRGRVEPNFGGFFSEVPGY
jgi:hypothetical protein